MGPRSKTGLGSCMRTRSQRAAGAPIPFFAVLCSWARRSSLVAEMVALLMVIGLAVSFLVACSALLRWNEVRYRKKGLPPGTMGWPVFGETTEFLKQGPGFMKNQRLRYGSLFKSHILGCPTVVCMDPELNRFVLMNEGKGFVPGYPQSMLDILGRSNIAAVHGEMHKTMRSAMLGLMALMSALKQIASIETGPVSESLKTEIFKLVLGTLSLPINIPGTNYYRGFKARKNLVGLLRRLIEERRISRCSYDDMLGSLLKVDDSSKVKLNDEQIIDLIIALVYSGYETVSTTSMMAVKYLHDHPRVLEELRSEHLEIRKGKSREDGIDWSNYKTMKFTRAVILETLRMATVVNGVLRKTTKDVAMKGFIIPKGWRIYVYTREINYDPLMYPEPLTFNPWRWLDKNLDSHHHFMLFGGGGRMCPGKELGTAEIATFLHYFVSRYRWEEVGGDNILKFPRVQAPNGLHIRVWDNQDQIVQSIR
ncbi:cytochrome P450 85A1-like isoform X2 [Musa acuminata AAA Group]|uniref:cytochrome P450 85A1-like isoform X2 n=1 Tax=Musa acuminata AAA Group TaxID=214697 RepID=UPI0031DDB05B